MRSGTGRPQRAGWRLRAWGSKLGWVLGGGSGEQRGVPRLVLTRKWGRSQGGRVTAQALAAVGRWPSQRRRSLAAVPVPPPSGGARACGGGSAAGRARRAAGWRVAPRAARPLCPHGRGAPTSRICSLARRPPGPCGSPLPLSARPAPSPAGPSQPPGTPRVCSAGRCCLGSGQLSAQTPPEVGVFLCRLCAPGGPSL